MNATELLELAPDQIAQLPSEAIPTLVQAALTLDRAQKVAAKTLEHMKARLVEEGRAEAHKSGIATIGTTWHFKSPEGESAEVQFPQDQLLRYGFFFIKGIAHRYKDDVLVKLGDIKGIAGEHFAKLFRSTYKPNKAIRELAPALLPKGKALELMRLCQEPSSPKVSFKTK